MHTAHLFTIVGGCTSPNHPLVTHHLVTHPTGHTHTSPVHCIMEYTPRRGLTDTCKNITFPQLLLWTVTMINIRQIWQNLLNGLSGKSIM